jgi:cation transport regulator ChaB
MPMKEDKLTEKEREFLKKVFNRTMSQYKEAIIKLQNA